MPLYEYQAVDRKGKKQSGAIDAGSLQEAKMKLLRREVYALQLKAARVDKIRSFLPKPDLLNLTKELARLLQAGLPLFEALSALEEKYRGQKQHVLLLDLCDKVRSGQPLSLGLKEHPETFDILYVGMIANAEKTARLEPALTELSEWLSRSLNLRKQLLSTFLYPALLTTFCIVVVALLLFYVIPSLRELFEGRELHPFTAIVFTVSQYACRFKVILTMAVLGMGIAGGLSLVFPSWKRRWMALGHRLPLLKQVFIKAALVRFTRAMATLLEGGLPLLVALEQSRLVVQHPLLEKVIAQTEKQLSEGQPLHVSFQRCSWIPPLVPRMLAIAEQGGNLSFMMRQIAEIYEAEIERTLTQFSTLAQPMILLVLGGIIGLTLLAVLLPLTDVSSFAAT